MQRTNYREFWIYICILYGLTNFVSWFHPPSSRGGVWRLNTALVVGNPGVARPPPQLTNHSLRALCPSHIPSNNLFVLAAPRWLTPRNCHPLHNSGNKSLPLFPSLRRREEWLYVSLQWRHRRISDDGRKKLVVEVKGYRDKRREETKRRRRKEEGNRKLAERREPRETIDCQAL